MLHLIKMPMRTALLSFTVILWLQVFSSVISSETVSSTDENLDVISVINVKTQTSLKVIALYSKQNSINFQFTEIFTIVVGLQAVSELR